MRKIEFDINDKFISRLSSLVMIPSWLKIRNAVMCWEHNDFVPYSGIIFFNDGDVYFSLDTNQIYDLHDFWFMQWILNLKTNESIR